MKRAHYNSCALAALACLLTAVLLRSGLAPALARLPADYVSEVVYAAKFILHQTPWSPPQPIDGELRRRDQTLSSGAGHAIVQGDAHWLTAAGTVIFENLGIYGVDRASHQNLAGYGDTSRSGQFLLPPHTAKQGYVLWDPVYAGPARLSFDHVEQFHGLQVYVFAFVADGVDESDAYASLPDVPERYRVLTYARGELKVEPVSGIVVDRADQGASYFVDPATHARVGEPLVQGGLHFTPQTVAAQLALAGATRRRMLALERWLPLVFLALGLSASGFCAWRGAVR